MVTTRHNNLHRLNPIFSWLRRNKFYSSTPIAGFSLIDGSKFKWEVTVWYLVLLVFSALTIQNATEIVGEYLKEPTVTKTSIVETKTTNLSLTNFTITLVWPKWFLFAREISENANKTNLTKRETLHSTKGISPESEVWTAWFNEVEDFWENLTISKEKFLYEKWPQAVTTAFVLLECDQPRKLRNITKRFIFDMNLLNISGNEFYWKLSHELQRQYTLVIQAVKGNLQISPMRSYFPVHFIGAKCYRNSVEVSLFVHVKRKVRRVMIASLLSKDIRKIYKPRLHKNEVTMTVADMNNGNVFDVDGIRPTQVFRVSVTGLFRSSVSCHDYRDHRDCEERCILDAFAQKCNCHPVSISYRKACQKVHPCYRLFTQYAPVAAVKSYGRAGDIITFMELIKNGAFMAFSEEPKNTFAGFLAEIGGIFDVWIGASMIGIVHLVIYIVKQFVYIWNKKTKAGGRLRMMLNRFEPSALIVPAAVAMRMRNLAGLNTESIEDEVTNLKNRISAGEQVQMSDLLELIGRQQLRFKGQIEKLEEEISDLKRNL